MINEKQEAQELLDDILLDSAEIEALFDTMWKVGSDTRDGYEQAAHWFCMGWAMATYLGKQSNLISKSQQKEAKHDSGNHSL